MEQVSVALDDMAANGLRFDRQTAEAIDPTESAPSR